MTSGLNTPQFLSEAKITPMIDKDYLLGISLDELKKRYGDEQVKRFLFGREGRLLELTLKRKSFMNLLSFFGSITDAVEYASFLSCISTPVLSDACPHFRNCFIKHKGNLVKLRSQKQGKKFFYEVVLPLWELYYEEIKKGVKKRLECSKKKLLIFIHIRDHWGELGKKLVEDLIREYVPEDPNGKKLWASAGFSV